MKHANLGLTVGAIGVVFGDIGTSTIYTLRECFSQTGMTVDPLNVYGFLSLIFWALTFVVSFKYVWFLMQANNRGEGGIMALGALALQATVRHPRLKLPIVAIATLGVALFYGDGIITPAISVLSAVEGLQTFSTTLTDFVLPISLVLLIGLFLVQKKGTRWLGKFSGPVMIVWFGITGALGLVHIIDQPQVLMALNPYYGATFMLHHGVIGLFAIGAVVLCITGAEAVYSDMGHFGLKPIRWAWFGLVYPALILNYFGQGALLLKDPSLIDDPFYHLVPEQFILAMVGLATLATLIASQAVITGAFSLSNQAVQIGLLPRLTVRHTDAQQSGQIYVPQINWLLLAGVVLLVLAFPSSAAIAGMYGVAVTGTMLATSILALVVLRFIWRRSWFVTLAVGGFFIAVDLLLFSSTMLKVHHGGYVSLILGAAVFAIMMTWRRGREMLIAKRRGESMPLRDLIDDLRARPLPRVPGAAIYMSLMPDVVPYPLGYNLKHNKSLHERVVLLTVKTADRPFVMDGDRVTVTELGEGVWHVVSRVGFMQSPRVLYALKEAEKQGLPINLREATFFVGRDRLIMSRRPGMARWRTRLFLWLANNAVSATDFYRLPHERVLEVGSQVEI